ncbi:M1 family aminopeptidase [Niveibacterium terrae]|uniref:ABC transporter permease/M1 family aminopeptidase n=1 Tax=Niveibacterium terrae TaxID=3373598 RepID=UPI003A94B960
MFARIAAFEARLQLRSPLFFIAFALFFLLVFGSVTIDQIQIGSRGNVNINSPFAMLQTLGIMNVFAIFVVVAFVANVIVRDDETGFAPILRSTRVGKFDYLAGRFVGALLVAFLVMTSVPLAILIGSAMPWLDPAKIGPFVASHYLYAVFVFGLPTLLVVGAMFFALATATRSMMWTYVGAVAALVLYIVSRTLMRDPQYDTISALSDPFGLGAFGQATKYWTAAERNTQMPALTGLMLANRLIWSGIALAMLVVTYFGFRFDSQSRRAKSAKPGKAEQAPALKPLASPRFGAATAWRQLLALSRFDMASVFKSPAFFVLLALGVLNSYGGLTGIVERRGTEFLPVTRSVIDALQGSFSMFSIIIAIFYAGELVWRDRQRRIHEIVDATAAPDWAHLLPKFVAITLVLASCFAAACATGIVFQLIHGYTHFELEAYALWFFVPGLVTAVLLAALSLFIQVLVPHKALGWAVMLVYLVATVSLNMMGYEHNLYNYAAWPSVPLSDMNGLGRFWIARAWFQVYWLAFALMLSVLGYGLWRHGAQDALKPRLGKLGRRLKGRPAWILGAATVVWAGCGVFIFWNTNVLNRYVTTPEHEKAMADYEKALLPFEKLPQPTITDVKLEVQLYPRETRALTRGRYAIENRTGKPLSEIHIRWDEALKLQSLELADATLVKEFPAFHYRIYRLAKPMQVGEKRAIGFATLLEEKGFPNGEPLTRIVANGSFLDNTAITPSIGMDRSGLLQDRSKRRKYGLPPELRMAKLEDQSANAHHYLRHDSDWVNADITLTTDADQTPVAPGYTVSDSAQGGRRTLHTRTDAPIHHFFSLQSARYAEKRAIWTNANGKPVELSVYYNPGHEMNVDRILGAMRTSLGLFSERFSPYQFRQARILEFPSYASFAQSFANTVPFSEAIGFVQKPSTDPEKVDLATYVTAHELAHQWWAHQIIGADKQGSTLLSESFAQYGAMLVMEKMYGAPMMRKFLKYELDGYLRARGGEVIEELPIVRVENQQYIHYQKGSLVMWWAREALGEETVDRALRRMLKLYAFKPAPYPSSSDFVRILREEAKPDQQQTITDLFEKITLYDMSATNATATRQKDGKYRVRFTVKGRKLYADGKGRETESPLAEDFELGAFTAEPGKKGFTAASVLHIEKKRLASGTTTVTFVLDKLPTHVGVDPYNKRIDRNSDDNLTKVTLQ